MTVKYDHKENSSKFDSEGGVVMVRPDGGGIDFFFCGSDHKLHYAKFGSESGSGDIIVLGVELEIKGTPAVVYNATGTGEIDVFAWGRSDNHLHHLKYNLGWKPWDNLSSKVGAVVLTSSPTATGDKDLLNVYFQSKDGKMTTQWKAGTAGWSDPKKY